MLISQETHTILDLTATEAVMLCTILTVAERHDLETHQLDCFLADLLVALQSTNEHEKGPHA